MGRVDSSPREGSPRSAAEGAQKLRFPPLTEAGEHPFPLRRRGHPRPRVRPGEISGPGAPIGAGGARRRRSFPPQGSSRRLRRLGLQPHGDPLKVPELVVFVTFFPVVVTDHVAPLPRRMEISREDCENRFPWARPGVPVPGFLDCVGGSQRKHHCLPLELHRPLCGVLPH